MLTPKYFCQNYNLLTRGQDWGYLDDPKYRDMTEGLAVRCYLDPISLQYCPAFAPLWEMAGVRDNDVDRLVFLKIISDTERLLYWLQKAEVIGDLRRDRRKAQALQSKLDELQEILNSLGKNAEELETLSESIDKLQLTECRIFENFVYRMAMLLTGGKLTDSFISKLNRFIDQYFMGIFEEDGRDYCRFSRKLNLKKFKLHIYRYDGTLHEERVIHRPV